MASSTADYIVVGGGLTGCVIASQLSRSEGKPNVILIEAGSDPSGKPNTDTFLNGLQLLGGEFDYAYQSEPVPTTAGRVHSLNAGKALGGGSLLNYGGWLRADAADYDEWGRAVGDKRWSYEGLKPWLDKAESRFGVKPVSSDPERNYPLRRPVEAAWRQLGAMPAETQTGSITGLMEMSESSKDGARQRSCAVYPLDEVSVLTNTVVHRIIMAGNVASGVLLDDGREITVREELIICAGAYRTPQLLMLSGIGPSDTLHKHEIPIVHPSPGVGQNLHDHFAIYLAFRLRDASQGLALGSAAWTNPSLFKGLPYDWVVSASLPPDVIARSGSDLDKENRNLFEVLTVYVPPGIPGIPIDGTHIATSTMLLLPTSRGTVSLRSADSNDAPEVRPNYLATNLDRQTLLYATRRTLKAMLATDSLKTLIESEAPPSAEGLAGLEPLTPEASDEVLLDRIERTGMQHHHSGGTAAMGTVVDAEGKVMGVERLRIADGSIVPMPLGGHPQATLYAVAEQLAHIILE
jgi:choline dehydrogenase-like flavoprotein